MKIIKEELREQFWDDIKRSSQERHEREISNVNDVVSAVKEIYYGSSIYPRKGPQSFRKEVNKKYRDKIDLLLTDIGTRIHDYFVLNPNCANSQTNFDIFHDELCDSFLNGINKIREKAHFAELNYGQAQKLINLTFKYLTEYSDYETYADLFHFSHMVIDKTILDTIESPVELSKFLGIELEAGVIILQHYWTHMSEKEYHDLLAEYRKVIDPHLGDESYMHLEYCIWNSKKHPHQPIDLQNSGGVDAMPISEFHK